MAGSPSEPIGLEALEREFARDANLLAYPSTPWTRDSIDSEAINHDIGALAVHKTRQPDAESLAGVSDVDVAIIGAGQAGLTVAAKLRREGVERVLVMDRANAGEEGPWVNWARMRTLRTTKLLHGPDAGHPAASFARWYIAQHGEAAWEALGLIPRETWAEYLGWIRRIFGVSVRNGTAVRDVTPDGTGFLLTLHTGGSEQVIRARRLVLCTGIDGSGGATIPSFVAELPRQLWAHTSHALPLSALRRARVGVLGIGASAFDNAAATLDAGARVVQFSRRAAFPTVNAVRSLESRGFFRHFDALPDTDRVEIGRRMLTLTVPPPQHSVDRCTAHDEYELRFDAAWQSVREEDGRAVVELADGSEEAFDFLILGTGFTVDLESVSWLQNLTPGLATWADRAALGEHPADARLGKYPYLARGMRGTARTPEAVPWAGHVHFMNLAATVSAGPTALGINGLPAASDHLVDELSRSLFREDAARLTQTFYEAAVEPEPAGAFAQV